VKREKAAKTLRGDTSPLFYILIRFYYVFGGDVTINLVKICLFTAVGASFFRFLKIVSLSSELQTIKYIIISISSLFFVVTSLSPIVMIIYACLPIC
jgi:hypothetical protein